MNELCRLIWCGLIGFFRSRASLEAEILVLRHQLNVLRRKSPKRPTFGNMDRLIFAGLYSLAPNVRSALAIVRPETVIRWHRAGFRLFWRWKSKSPAWSRSSCGLLITRRLIVASIHRLMQGLQ